MEKVTVVGKRYVNFKDDSGKVVTGWSIYYTMAADGVTGVMADKMFISDQRAGSMILPDVGKAYEVFYDRYGRPNKFNPV